MTQPMLLRLAAELRERAATASDAERRDLLYLADEYEVSARSELADKLGAFSVKIPK